MKIRLSDLRRIIREMIQDVPRSTCRVCRGSGEASDSPCAGCGGTGEEISYEANSQMKGVGRSTVPHTK